MDDEIDDYEAVLHEGDVVVQQPDPTTPEPSGGFTYVEIIDRRYVMLYISFYSFFIFHIKILYVSYIICGLFLLYV